MPSDFPQQRRRVDRDQQSRPLAERVLIGLGLIAALAGMAGGAWWLFTQTGVGTLVRDSSPSWTPTGEVVFTSEIDGNADIVVTDQTGDNRRAVVEGPGDDGGAAYSPDGLELLFHSDRDGNFDIFKANADGLAPVPLTRDPAVDQMPSWSRDGKQIVFMSNRANGKTFDIYRMNADGTNVERLTSTGSNWFPEYSPDGGQLALHVERDVWIMSLSTKGMRRVTNEPANGMHPTWSPDGHKLAFMSWRNGRSEVFTWGFDGTEPKAVVTMPTGDAIDPKWSPDGRFIAFVHVPAGVDHDQDGRSERVVYIVEVTTGRLQRISR